MADLETLLEQVTSERKKQLFALACCKRIAGLENHLDKLELFIDGKISRKDLEEERNKVANRNVLNYYVYYTIYSALSIKSSEYGIATAYWAAVSTGNYDEEILKQLELLKDIYNPCLLDLKFSSLAISLAEQVYEGDDNARGILSDLLEDESYPSEIVLHLKSGFHPKGCWLIDQILGKS